MSWVIYYSWYESKQQAYIHIEHIRLKHMNFFLGQYDHIWSDIVYPCQLPIKKWIHEYIAYTTLTALKKIFIMKIIICRFRAWKKISASWSRISQECETFRKTDNRYGFWLWCWTNMTLRGQTMALFVKEKQVGCQSYLERNIKKNSSLFLLATYSRKSYDLVLGLCPFILYYIYLVFNIVQIMSLIIKM